MERILVLVDSTGLQRETLEFACYIANLTKSKVTGLIFNPDQQKELQKVGTRHRATSESRGTADQQHHFAEQCVWQLVPGKLVDGIALPPNQKNLPNSNVISPN